MINVEIVVLKIHSNIIISKDHNYCYQITTSLSIYVLSNKTLYLHLGEHYDVSQI